MRKARWMSLLVAALGATTAGAKPLPGGTLNPLTIPKYVQPLVVPPAMPEAVDPTGAVLPNTYDIGVRQFSQQVLPAPLPATKVWGYGAVNTPATFHYPAFTIEARQGTPTTVTWRNELVVDPAACATSLDRANDPACNFLPHLFPIDQTLHWANPPMDCRAGEIGPDCRGNSPLQYTGPVPIVTHLHGGHIDPLVDGYPEAWFLPNANDIPDGYATVGSNYPAGLWAPGTAVYTYRNDQRGTTLWYHDHALGMTRSNVYTGMAGFYFLRDAYELDLVNGTDLTGRNGALQRIPSGAQEVPLAIQDRSFDADGSLFYPGTRAFFDGFAGPYFPDPASDVPPTWNPEFFGNTMVVNGRTWPFFTTEARRYRLRFLNGTDSRFLILQFADAKGKPLGLPFHVIGNDGGFLPGAPAAVTQLVIGPGERYDTIVDFSAFLGQRILLANVGPDSPWGGGKVPSSLASDPDTTGQVMRFDVVARTGVDATTLPAGLVLSQPADPFGVPAATGPARTLTLNEIVSVLPFAGPIEAQLGDWRSPLPWRAPITEFPGVGATEVWNIVNRTVDSHPIHLHQVQFVVMDRTPIDLAAWDAAVAACAAAPGTCPETGPDPMAFAAKKALPAPAFPWEAGAKDTVITNPGEITRVRALFDIAGLYVWHCHILSHEDNEMMRHFCVGGGCLK